jgi:hypothetical protein
MKILVARHTYEHEYHPQDYLCDNVFHGLHSLGHEVTDDRRCWYFYRSEFESWGGKHKLDAGHFHGTLLYGGGFSYAATLDEDMSIVRDHDVIRERIKDHYYDKIVIGRPDWKPSYLDLVFEHYDRKDILALDGIDEGTIDRDLASRTTYFKRELFEAPGEFLVPISFGIPRVKCRTDSVEKAQLWGTVIPYRSETYIYKVEAEYYADYARSMFAHTCKKSGWDCMRHYEILANRCIPYFHNLEQVPAETMKTLPKSLLLYAKSLIDQHGPEYFIPGNPGWPEYCNLEQKIHQHFVEHCTTEALAQYVLKSVV